MGYVLAAAKEAQWFLKGGKDHALDALGFVAAPIVFLLAVAARCWWLSDTSVAETTSMPTTMSGCILSQIRPLRASRLWARVPRFLRSSGGYNYAGKLLHRRLGIFGVLVDE